MAQPASAARPSTFPPEGTEAAARLASIRQALRTADMIAGKTTEQLAEPVAIVEVWPHLPPSTRRCFADRSDRAANAALGGLELCSNSISPAAAERLRKELRESLTQVERLFAAR